MNSLQDLLNDLNQAWKNVEHNLNLEVIQAEWKRIFDAPTNWWQKLDADWQHIFLSSIGIMTTTRTPSDQEIKKILSLTKLDCSDTKIVFLNPIRNLKFLQELNCSNTNITDLDGVQYLPNLLKINCSNTQIHSLTPLQKNVALRSLNCSMTDVDDLKPLRKLTNLKELDCNTTFIKKLKALDKLQKLQELNCENTPLKSSEIKRFKRKHPHLQLIFTHPTIQKKRWFFW